MNGAQTSAKNIVICCDGTANEFATDRTNVIKLYATLQHESADQVTYYHPGIGTMEPFGSLSPITRRLTRALGMAVGYGLETDVRDAYVFLMQQYRPGDRIFLFGFSRGAFTIRVVASLVKMYGILRPGNEPLVPYAIRMLMGIQRAQQDPSAQAAYFQLAHEFQETMAWARPTIRFVGAWDTVSSVGWIENPLHVPYEANNPDIEIGRHAVAIDERRAFFRTHLWQPPQDPAKPRGPRDLLQVWFPGVHCDVGGGYPEQSAGLSKYALEWMIAEARNAGLLVDAVKARTVLGLTSPEDFVPAAPEPPMHESLTGWWHLAEFLPKRHWNWQTKRWERRMNRYRRRTMPPGALIHDAAYARGAAYQERFPPDAVRVSTRGSAE